MLFMNADLQLAGRWQKEKIGAAHSVNRRHKGNGDAAPYVIDLIEMLHHLNQAEHGAQDADRWRKATRRLEDLRDALLGLGLIVQLQLHDPSQLDWISTV